MNASPAEKTISFDEYLSELEASGRFTPPFNAHERALARAAAGAHYFLSTLTEMPGRVSRDSEEWGYFFLGLHLIHTRREGRG